MKLKMLTTYGSPTRIIDAGKVGEFEQAEAKALIDGGYAVPLGQELPPDRARRIREQADKEE